MPASAWLADRPWRWCGRRTSCPFEVVASGSNYTAEYLKGVERGDEGKCGDLTVSDTYERAMGTPMETALAILNVDLAQTALQVNRMIHRLGSARKAEADTKAKGQAPCPDAPDRTGTADGGQSGGVENADQAPTAEDTNGA